MRTLITSMTLVMFPPHVLGPKYERRQRPRNSQGFRIGRSRGNLAMTPDVAVVISLNRFWAPVDDTVTAHSKTQVTSHKPRCANQEPVQVPGQLPQIRRVASKTGKNLRAPLPLSEHRKTLVPGAPGFPSCGGS